MSDDVPTPLVYPYCQVLPNGKGAVVLLWKDQIEWLTRELGDHPWGGIATQINSEMHMALSRIKEHETVGVQAANKDSA
ncbi:MAG TPA: hypothetical protein VFX78_00005 [Candidatus Eisenbacteria bacterium]|nr:hypothetical protein [Candidatus Eisenbacteria bacterium]